MTEKPDIESLSITYRFLDDLMYKNDWATLDTVLHNTSELEHPAFVIVYIRGTFAVRDKLMEWQPLLQRFANHLKNIGRDPKLYLLGLEKYYE